MVPPPVAVSVPPVRVSPLPTVTSVTTPALVRPVTVVAVPVAVETVSVLAMVVAPVVPLMVIASAVVALPMNRLPASPLLMYHSLPVEAVVLSRYRVGVVPVPRVFYGAVCADVAGDVDAFGWC